MTLFHAYRNYIRSREKTPLWIDITELYILVSRIALPLYTQSTQLKHQNKVYRGVLNRFLCNGKTGKAPLYGVCFDFQLGTQCMQVTANLLMICGSEAVS